MEAVSQLAQKYCYPRRKHKEPDEHWFAFRVCWYRPTPDVMPLWRQDVLDLCTAMETSQPSLVVTVREALSTLSDEQLLELLDKDPTLAPLPDGDIYGKESQ